MKKFLPIFILIVSFFMFCSCGKDGIDGKDFLAINNPGQYCYHFTSYTDNNPGIPYGFSSGTHYSSQPGSYYYDYYVSSTCGYTDYHCTGTYTLSVDPGTKAKLFRKGVDGVDRYYDLYCEYSGATESYKKNPEPVKFDTTYVYDGYSLRVTGNIVFGETAPEDNNSKYHK